LAEEELMTAAAESEEVEVGEWHRDSRQAFCSHHLFSQDRKLSGIRCAAKPFLARTAKAIVTYFAPPAKSCTSTVLIPETMERSLVTTPSSRL
jgi:hypothetical protein